MCLPGQPAGVKRAHRGCGACACPSQPPLPPSRVHLLLCPLYFSTFVGYTSPQPLLLSPFPLLLSFLSICKKSHFSPCLLFPISSLAPCLSILHHLSSHPSQSPCHSSWASLLADFLLSAFPLDHTEQCQLWLFSKNLMSASLVSLTVLPWEINLHHPDLSYGFRNLSSCFKVWGGSCGGKEKFAFPQAAWKGSTKPHLHPTVPFTPDLT